MDKPPIGLGATREELRRLLGEPTEMGAPMASGGEPDLWCYKLDPLTANHLVSSVSKGEPDLWRSGRVHYYFNTDGRVWLILAEDRYGGETLLGELAEDSSPGAEPGAAPDPAGM
jgi:hypothetical protein